MLDDEGLHLGCAAMSGQRPARLCAPRFWQSAKAELQLGGILVRGRARAVCPIVTSGLRLRAWLQIGSGTLSTSRPVARDVGAMCRDQCALRGLSAG